MSKGISIKFEGLDKLISSIEAQPAKVKAEAGEIIQNTALRVEKRAKNSAPVDTGYLKQHITAEKTGELSADVTSLAEYSIYNEFGTRKMAAHPYMRPALNQEQPFIYQKLDNLIKKGLL
ncbi:HK97-gp10 family putative phage morphogenesis protein [Weissella paramesenteroides]|uniref:HK97-gp10 family putative phage morphogenesis protein n=1 Tax=Weissella paramesenteroides TaxID=1249 RepID=UPI00123AA31B|nr:HK97-gp10 family putative phage morphogenesis protein [Weissella paramesenteroides]KAA8455243.1 HK97 gp10 family phage protein [Weissella paramesenteroides]KAA8456296.1 HK97 gp10 family phage protein [Weissella paramesenteroides]KAA8458213.1 HK97 gp10 family phage protein [Weissella paramesenteroides]KAA8460204.1 HK97 gp10 family phage protein [Weissella paramesenteroides]KAA8461546.1 HK97 gp10 family phage protein [Weissella paramesenteroides]